MKISDVRPGALEIYKIKSEKSQEQQNERGVQEKDRAEISPRGQELQKYREILGKMDDIRADRVRQLKESITAGTYKPEAEKIAEKIIADRRRVPDR